MLDNIVECGQKFTPLGMISMELLLSIKILAIHDWNTTRTLCPKGSDSSGQAHVLKHRTLSHMLNTCILTLLASHRRKRWDDLLG